MKKYLFILAASFALTSCYDDYVKDNDTQAVGFANQTDVRSVIVGEGMRFSTGVALGGTMLNTSPPWNSTICSPMEAVVGEKL